MWVEFNALMRKFECTGTEIYCRLTWITPDLKLFELQNAC